MKLHLTQSEGKNLITAYDYGYVAINGQRYKESLIVLPDLLIEHWSSSPNITLNFDTLISDDFAKIASIKPEVILLGTGKLHRFLHPKISAILVNEGISIECMTTAAACRTYNILMGEGRHVAAAILI